MISEEEELEQILQNNINWVSQHTGSAVDAILTHYMRKPPSGAAGLLKFADDLAIDSFHETACNPESSDAKAYLAEVIRKAVRDALASREECSRIVNPLFCCSCRYLKKPDTCSTFEYPPTTRSK